VPGRCAWSRSRSRRSSRGSNDISPRPRRATPPPSSPDPMSVDLVTGSSGLLGHCVVMRLRAEGRRVRVVDVLPPPRGLMVEGVEAVVADMRDGGKLREAARGIDTIYHLAAGQRMKPQFSGLGEDEIRSMNVSGVANVLAAARANG